MPTFDRKLSDEDYRAIFTSEKPAAELAAQYGVHERSINRIWRRETRVVLLVTRDLPRRSHLGNYEGQRLRQVALEMEE